MLSVVWLGLMSFGVISIINPPWLQELSRPGIENECLTLKKYGDAALREHQYNLAAGQYRRALEISEAELAKFGLYRPFDPSGAADSTEVNHVQLIPHGGPVPLTVVQDTFNPDPSCT